ncbi:uncharacterized protein I303_103700 [Kwoniella dejecticola CBS 10117]|uniref:Uncharacterized protein n=1 Tax=Kwoniella dejecticola CBS 10117 TaxID=1296121 RepID=A0A1A6A7G5_9TREE|nr:uncharacterized protein I303_03716 [Kwoniella dejecticola CBS 10117]OBR86000.1 hypothetical protein I303_03716 [Kwoniella dejecticola CBS 10117]
MKENKAVENVLATLGAILWALQAIPQVYKSYRSKSTKGLSPSMMCIWAASSLFFCIYVSSRHLAIPMIVQPHVSLILFSISWAQCLYYSYNYSFLKSLLCWGVWMGVAAGFEIGSIFGLLAAKDNGTEIPMVVYGYMSSALSFLGLLPQYHEIYRTKEVTGLSFAFIFTDIVGALVFILSLFFRAKLDISAFVMYAVTAAMVIVLVVLALILNPRAAKRRRLREIRGQDTPTGSNENDAAIVEIEKTAVVDRLQQSQNHDAADPEIGYFVHRDGTHSYPSTPGSVLI